MVLEVGWVGKGTGFFIGFSASGWKGGGGECKCTWGGRGTGVFDCR